MTQISQAVRERVRVAVAHGYRGAVRPDLREMDVQNAFYSFWFLERGTVDLRWTDGRVQARDGDAVCLPAGFRRSHRFSPTNAIVSLSFAATWDDGRSVVRAARPAVVSGRAAGRLGRLARAVVRHLDPGRGPLSDLRLTLPDWLDFDGALHRAACEILQTLTAFGGEWSLPQTSDPRLDAVLADLRRNPSAAPLPFARWRELTGLGRVQLERLARRQIGDSLRHRRDAILWEDVQRALTAGRESFKEIAARLAFCDAAHFSRWVRHRTGRSPREWRAAGHVSAP